MKNTQQMAGRHKEVIYVGYGVTLKTGLHRFPILCYIAEFLRVFPYFFHHSKDFFFGRNIYHSGSGKINIHLHIGLFPVKQTMKKMASCCRIELWQEALSMARKYTYAMACAHRFSACWYLKISHCKQANDQKLSDGLLAFMSPIVLKNTFSSVWVL